MLTRTVEAVQGRIPFSLLIHNVRIVNVYNDTITEGQIGLVGDRIAYVGPKGETWAAEETLDGGGCYALPGFVDSHMHLESSMMTPGHFAGVALSCGTTTVAADPHEIGNVLGLDGVRALMDAAKGLPLRVLVMAPSTIPSAPGFENSGYDVGAREAARLLDLPGIAGLGEVMDFHGAAGGDPRILSVVEEAVKRDCLIDGHASLLTGRDLQAFRAAGIDSDHTLRTADKLLEELALGFTVQVQSCCLNRELVEAMNTVRLQEQICLVTDDVPLPKLMGEGHLNHVVEEAVALGLDPLRAIRFATINPARRLRLYHVGAIAPGMTADIQLVRDLKKPRPELVVWGGRPVFRDGELLEAIPEPDLAEVLQSSVRCRPVCLEDLEIRAPGRGTAEVHVIRADPASTRTACVLRELPAVPAAGKAMLDTTGYLKMAVFNRYGLPQHGVAVVEGAGSVSGAVALTYGHDAHNLTVFGGNDRDMVLAANAVIEAQGGICAARDGRLQNLVRLPVAGLMSTLPPQELLAQLQAFLKDCTGMGFRHADLMSFFTIMPLAVSPEIRCTDRGLVDVVHKRLLPLIEQMKEES